MVRCRRSFRSIRVTAASRIVRRANGPRAVPAATVGIGEALAPNPSGLSGSGAGPVPVTWVAVAGRTAAGSVSLGMSPSPVLQQFAERAADTACCLSAGEFGDQFGGVDPELFQQPGVLVGVDLIG